MNIKFIDKLTFTDLDKFQTDENKYFDNLEDAIKNAELDFDKRFFIFDIIYRIPKSPLIGLLSLKELINLYKSSNIATVYMSLDKSEIYGIQYEVEYKDGRSIGGFDDFGLIYGDYKIPTTRFITSSIYPGIIFDRKPFLDKAKLA